MNKIVINNLKDNHIDNSYINKIKEINTNKKIIILPNKYDLYKLDYSDLGTQNIIDSDFKYVLLGHHDVRVKEDDILINKKIKDALDNNMIVIICVNSIDTLIKDIEGITSYKNIMIGYEVDELIGGSEILSKDNIIEFINKAKKLTNNRSKVLYGGGIRSNNINSIKNIDILDGILIGKACLDIEEYKKIINNY